MVHLTSTNADLIGRVRRIAGQVGAVEQAVTADAGCAEVLRLLAEVRGAVGGLLDDVVAEHLEAHVSRPGLDDAERAIGAEQLLAVVGGRREVTGYALCRRRRA